MLVPPASRESLALDSFRRFSPDRFPPFLLFLAVYCGSHLMVTVWIALKPLKQALVRPLIGLPFQEPRQDNLWSARQSLSSQKQRLEER